MSPKYRFLLSLAFAFAFQNSAAAGPEELSTALESAGGKVILRELGLSGALDPSGAPEAVAFAEESVARVRTRYLAERPGASDPFAMDGALPETEERLLAGIAAGSVELRASLGELRFIEMPASDAVPATYSSARGLFLSSGPTTGVAAPLPATKAEGARVRALLRKLLLATGQPELASKARAIREALNSDAEVLAWAAGERDFQSLGHAADLSLGSRGGAFTELGKAFSALPELKNALSISVRAFADASPVEREAILAAPGDVPYAAFAEKVNEALAGAKLSDSAAFRTLTDPKQGYDLSSFTPERAKAFERILTGYYDRMNLTDKREIVAAVLDLAPGAPIEKQLSAILQRSGPGMQKLFQLFGQDAKSPLVRNVMRELLSGVQPVGAVTARATIEAELGVPIEAYFEDFDENPLAAATVGQVHRARLRGGRDVIVKFVKPGVRERALREIVTLKEIAGKSAFEQNLVGNVEDALLRELDLRREAANLQVGSFYTSALDGLWVAGLVEKVPATRGLIVQELASGKALSSLTSPTELASPERLSRLGLTERAALAADLRARGQALSDLLERWFERALFGDGFFHADLHPGNIFAAKLPIPLMKPQLTLIDFGSADVLSVAQRRALVKFGLGVTGRSPKQVVEALATISPMDAQRAAALRREIAPALGGQGSAFEKLKGVLGIALDRGVQVPRELFLFVRGDLFLEKQIAEINRALELVDPLKVVGRVNNGQAYFTAISKHVALHAPGSMLRMVSPGLRNLAAAFTGNPDAGSVADELLTMQSLEAILGSIGRR